MRSGVTVGVVSGVLTLGVLAGATALGVGGVDDAAVAVDEIVDEVAADAELDAQRAAEREADRAALAAGVDERKAQLEVERQAARAAAAEAEREQEERRAAEEREAVEQQRAQLQAAQQRLADLGYLVGAVDGEQGQQTTAALMAFQAVNGIQVDGILGPQTQAMLDEPARSPQLGDGPATRIEIDMDLQVLHLVEGGERVVTFKTSTGGGHVYERGDGSRATARTPVGEFVIERRIEGVRESSAGLGTLYDPLYFFHGYAIHGSNSVPAGPASAGCARLARADAVWLFHRVPDGTPVHLHGGQHTFVPRGA